MVFEIRLEASDSIPSGNPLEVEVDRTTGRLRVGGSEIKLKNCTFTSSDNGEAFLKLVYDCLHSSDMIHAAKDITEMPSVKVRAPATMQNGEFYTLKLIFQEGTKIVFY